MDLGLFEPVITKSIELIDEELRFLFGVKNSMKLLGGDLLMIKAFLREVEGKQKGRKVEKEFFKLVQDVAYESEDLIETYIFKVVQQRRTCVVGNWILCCRQLPKVHLVGTEIQRIRERLKEILDKREILKLEDSNKSEASSSNQSPFHAESREPSMEDEIGLVGMENEAQSLVDQLITGDANNSIVSLIGMGGIGKTTLARRIYNSDLVRNHFHHRSWVTVSKPFILSRELLVNIMADVNCINKQDEEEMKKIGVMTKQELGEKLSGYLRCKRYLVVLDDVWTTQDWDLLKHIFPVVDNKGAVMLTSRKKDVGQYANPRRPPCEIRVLNEEEAWELFCKKVLDCPSDLEDLGKKIVRKCGGLPLAVAVLGGILRGREKNLNEYVSSNCFIPDFVLKLPRLGHLMMASHQSIRVRGVPLPESNSLQTLRACASAVDESFGNLIHLKKLALLDNFDLRQANCIAKMKHLRSLTLKTIQKEGTVNLRSSMHLAGKESLTKLVLDKVPSRHDFPPQLTKLILRWSLLRSDPFEELKHLPNLRILELNMYSYVGSRLVSSGGGFPRLESLALEQIFGLEDWEVEEGAFPRLSHIRIRRCRRLGMLPEGFRHITTLNKLELVGMREEFNARVKEAEGEDYYKIQHVQSLLVAALGGALSLSLSLSRHRLPRRVTPSIRSILIVIFGC